MNGLYPDGCLGSINDRGKVFTPTSLAEAQAKQAVLEAVVTMCDAAHNLIVDLGCVKGIIARDEGAIGISDGSTRDIALISRVGKPVCFVRAKLCTDENGRLYALLSRKMGKKYIIKIDSDFDVDVDILGFVDPGVTVNIIRDGETAEKKTIGLPERLTNVLTCKNPRCISATEQELPQIFKLTDRERRVYRCLYCETKAK